MQRTVLRAVVAMVLLGSPMATLPARTQSTEVGAATEFRGLDGTRHTLAELSGKPTVVNFWATWCIPCKEEMPRLQTLSERYEPKGVRFIAISMDGAETQPRISGLIAKRHFGVPVWTGATESTLKELQLGNVLPATLILDENGIAIGKIVGEAREKDISSRLDWLLNGRQGKQPKVLQKNDW